MVRSDEEERDECDGEKNSSGDENGLWQCSDCASIDETEKKRLRGRIEVQSMKIESRGGYIAYTHDILPQRLHHRNRP